MEDVFDNVELSSGDDEGGIEVGSRAEPAGVVLDGGGAHLGEFLPLDWLEVAVVVWRLLRAPPQAHVVELVLEENRRVYEVLEMYS